MKKKIYNILALIVSAATLFSSFTAAAVPGETKIITIRNEKDLISLAKKCKTDTWSKDKTVELSDDIDLSGSKFESIPIFSGTFKGNGHKISGYKLKTRGSAMGFFRYVQEGAVIDGLHISGDIAPGGTKDTVGAVAGENGGRIRGCSFSGSVEGDSNVGGICGYVTETGMVEDCYFWGTVSGNSYTGGICGQNFGTAKGCSNKGKINITVTDREKSVDELSEDIQKDVENIGTTQSVSSNTDTGGVCGYNKGKIIKCINKGSVGYKSVGYNTGGICGRNAGYISGCRNYGEVNGRKDIGGICGQAEPYVLLEYSADILTQMQKTLDKIRDVVNNSNDDEILDRLDDINTSASGVTDDMDILYDEVKDYTQNLTDSINNTSDRLHTALESSEYVFDDISDGTENISNGLESMKKSIDSLDSAVKDISDAIDTIKEAQPYTERANEYLERAMNQMSSAMRMINKSLTSLIDSAENLKEAVKRLIEALKGQKGVSAEINNVASAVRKIQESSSAASSAFDDLSSALENLKKSGYFNNVSDDVIKNVDDISDKFKDISEALKDVYDALLLMQDFDIYSLATSFKMLEKGFESLSKAFYEINRAASKLYSALDKVKNVSDKADQSLNYAKDAVEFFKKGSDEIKSASDKLGDIVSDFTKGGKFEIPEISDAFKDSMEDLKKSVRTMQDQFRNLNNSVKNKKNSVYDDIDIIGDQLDMLVSVAKNNIRDKSNLEKEDFIEDISENGSFAETTGKIEESENYGKIAGDINAGGVCGSMAIEYDFDPEDDVMKGGDKSFNFKYKTKCIIRRCTNSGEVTLKKKFGGGICGNAELGLIISCDNYGIIGSDSGDYLGGVSGKSEITIRNCASKCTLYGGDYIGGIAGDADKITECAALVNITEHGEYTGAVAGKAEKEKLHRNFFVGGGFGAVDDINYSGYAEEGNIERFVSFVKSNLNKDVIFRLRFFSGKKLIKEIQFNYEDSIPDSDIPKVPQKAGYYGKWTEYDFSNASYDADLYAEYSRSIDIIESEEKRENNKPVILVCGAFDDNAEVTAKSTSPINRSKDAYLVNIRGTYTKKYKVRYLPATEKGNCDILVDTGNGPEKVKTTDYGSYKEFSVKEPVFRVYEVKRNYALIIALSAAGVFALIAAMMYIVKKKGNPKTKKE